MRLPFGVHASVRADFERRWARARPLLLLGFLGPPVVSAAVALLTPSSRGGALGWVLLVLGVVPPLWFLLGRVYPHRTDWWVGLVTHSGAVQLLGVAFLSPNPLLVLPTAVATAVAAALVVRARVLLLDVTGAAIAGTTLGVRSSSRQVRSAAGRRLAAHATFDGEVLRWHVGTGPSTPDTSGGELPLHEVTDVWVADTSAAPGGPVVVVRAGGRDVELVVGHPHDFAAVLGRRVRLLDSPDWS